MAEIEIAPFVLKDSVFKVEDDDFAAACSQVEFTPTTSSTTWKGLKRRAKFTAIGDATWGCQVAYAQDWETAGSLSRYLHAHEGETKDVVFEPISGGTAFAARIIITPGGIGGIVDNVGTGTATLGVDGRPEEVVVPPVIP